MYKGLTPEEYDDFDFYAPIEARVEAEIEDSQARAEMMGLIHRLANES